VNAPTLTKQKQLWEKFKREKKGYKTLFHKLCSIFAFNKTIAWFAGGVPRKQLELIKNDGIKVTDYFFRCIDNMVSNSHLKDDNYFYYNMATGKYTKNNCPAYLRHENYNKFHNGDLLNRLVISNDYFINELRNRKYDKIILMDHVDWQCPKQAHELAKALYDHTNPGAKIIFRSAALYPFYADILEEVGFKVVCLDRITNWGYMDRVNMYASFYLCTK
jgi:betaine lipid synthase